MYWRYFWAIFLIVIGFLFLGNNLGLLPGNMWSYIWPLFLILLGVMFLLGATGRDRNMPTVNDSLALDGTTNAQIKFKHGAGRLTVNAGRDANLLLSGAFGGGVDKRVQHIGERLNVELRTAAREWTDWGPWMWWGGHGAFDWEVRLNPNIPLVLRFETGASHTLLDLSALRVTELHIETGASATEITLPVQAGTTRVRIESGAASVKVRVPQGVGARIRGTMGLGTLDVDTQRFAKRGSEYESEDYATTTNRADIEIESGVGTVEIR